VKILIVDDEPATRLVVATAVQRLGHTPLQAEDGDEGWQAFSLHRPQVVITDWAMPGLDGTELSGRIRAAEQGYTYIMLLSAQADENASRDAMLAGADDVLAKPPDPAELERGLIAAERLISMHGQLAEDARRDASTGAGSRLRLDEDLAAICARVKRYGHSYCVAMIVLEPAAEDVMRRAGSALGQEIRSGDMLYRHSKAAFVVLLPEQGLETANLAADRLRRASEHAASAGTKVSVGMVTTGAEPEPETLLAAAEAAAVRAAQPESGGIVGQGAEESGALRLLVADDDPVSRLMLGAIVKREPGFELVGEAADATSAIDLALRRRPDVVLLDVDMPGGGGARAAVEIREGLPNARIVAISADDSQNSQYDMMRAGAVGFLTKGASDDEILRVIRSSARW
jgi:CheY-like chemotaxis protein